MTTQESEQLLLANGWTMECLLPLEIRHTDGSFASGQAAAMVVQSLQTEQAATEASPASSAPNAGVLFEELLRLHANLNQVVSTASKQQATDSESWAMAYGLTFSAHGSRRVHEILEALEQSLDYYDPDASYEEDIRAFLNALNKKVVQLMPFFGA